MTTGSNSLFNKWAGLFVCVASLLAISSWLAVRTGKVDHARVFGISYNNDVPFHFQGSNGIPSGLAVQIVSEAARRAGIQLNWLYSSLTNKPDLWVLMTIREDRKDHMHFTDPYLQTETYFVVLANSPFHQVKDLSNARISYLDFGIHRKNLAGLVPAMQPVPVGSSRDALAKLAGGMSDAAYLDRYAVMPALLAGEGGAALRLIPSHAPVGKLALASTLANAAVADEIRSAMNSMVDDGTMSTIVAQWGVFPNLTSDMIDGLVLARRRARGLTAGIAALSALLIISAGLAVRSWIQASELQFAGAALRRSETKSRALLEAIPDLMYRLSRDGVMLDFHASSGLKSAASGGMIINKNIGEIYPPTVGAEFLRHIQAVLTEGGIRLFEYTINPSAREARFFEARMVPSGPDEVLAIVREITDRKRADEERAKLESQIQQTRKIESIGLLAGGIAHDFNNILAAMMMRLDLLRAQTTNDQEISDSVGELVKEAQRAASLTRQLLAFSRRSSIELKVLDLNELVARVLKMLVRLIGEHITVRINPSTRPALVEGDAGMLEQILINLSLNARDAMPSGGVLSIRVDLMAMDAARAKGESTAASGNFICLTVADQGCGMDEATRARIFEPFFTTKEPGKGTGLGLSTVYGIVVQHKGWIEVVSSPGNGSTFKVFLPAAAKSVEPAGLEPVSMDLCGREVILVVEDDESLRKILVLNLRQLGYEVLEATDGRAAMAIWEGKAGQIDLMITDIIMPQGINGLDLAERFKRQKPKLKVIVSSGYSIELGGHAINSAEGIVYLPKPYTIGVLAKTVRDCLDAR